MFASRQHTLCVPIARTTPKRLLMLRMVLLVLLICMGIFLVPRLFSRPQTIIRVGSTAPGFTLSSQQGDLISLKDFRGSWVVLYFYPKDQTPACTREAHNFQLDQPNYAERHAVVLGVSVDSVDSHMRFCAKEGLHFKLLADTDGRVSRAYASLTNFGIVKFATRHTFLIDPNGKLAKAYPSVDPARHSEEVLAALDELQKQSNGVN